MNATNRPIDVLLNAKTAQVPESGNREFGLSHSNTRENSFDRVLDQQRYSTNDSNRDKVEERRDRSSRVDAESRSGRAETRTSETRDVAKKEHIKASDDTPVEAKKNSDTGNDLPVEGEVTNTAEDIAAEISVKDEKLVIDISVTPVEDAEEQTDTSQNFSDLEIELEQSIQGLLNAATTQQNSGLGQDKVVQTISIPALVNQLKQAAASGEIDAKLETALKNLTGQLSGKFEIGEGLDKGIKLDVFADYKGFSLGQELKALLRGLDAHASSGSALNLESSTALNIGSSTASESRNPAINSLLQSIQTSGLAGAGKAGLTTSTIQAPVSSPNWGQAVAQRIAWLAGSGVQAAQLNLNPQDLGPVEVRISVTNDQTNINFSSQHGAVRDALAQSVDLLRDMLEANGLSLVDVNVSDQSLAEQQESESGSDKDASSIAGNNEIENDVGVVAQQQIISSSLVDYYA